MKNTLESIQSLRNEVKQLASSISEVSTSLQHERNEKFKEMMLASVENKVRELVASSANRLPCQPVNHQAASVSQPLLTANPSHYSHITEPRLSSSETGYMTFQPEQQSCFKVTNHSPFYVTDSTPANFVTKPHQSMQVKPSRPLTVQNTIRHNWPPQGQSRTSSPFAGKDFMQKSLKEK